MENVLQNEDIQKRITARRYIRQMFGLCGILRCPAKPTDLYQIGIQNEYGFHLRGSGTTLEAALKQTFEELRQCSTSSAAAPPPPRPSYSPRSRLPPEAPQFLPQRKRLHKGRLSSQKRANTRKASNTGNAAANTFKHSRCG